MARPLIPRRSQWRGGRGCLLALLAQGGCSGDIGPVAIRFEQVSTDMNIFRLSSLSVNSTLSLTITILIRTNLANAAVEDNTLLHFKIQEQRICFAEHKPSSHVLFHCSSSNRYVNTETSVWNLLINKSITHKRGDEIKPWK